MTPVFRTAIHTSQAFTEQRHTNGGGGSGRRPPATGGEEHLQTVRNSSKDRPSNRTPFEITACGRSSGCQGTDGCSRPAIVTHQPILVTHTNKAVLAVVHAACFVRCGGAATPRGKVAQLR
jgi:hypothetical protein